jgi:hypothetical protein
MKKYRPASIVLAVLLLAASCGGKKVEAPQSEATPTESATVEPIIDTSKAETIDAELAKYDAIVARYLEDTGNNKPEALAADEEELATVSEALSELAADFSAEQLKKYNEITARMSE